MLDRSLFLIHNDSYTVTFVRATYAWPAHWMLNVATEFCVAGEVQVKLYSAKEVESWDRGPQVLSPQIVMAQLGGELPYGADAAAALRW